MKFVEEIVKNILKPYLDEIHTTCKLAFDEARKDRYWNKLDSRYRSTRISAVTTHLLEEKFKEIGILTNRSHNSFRFKIDNVVGRFKKLNKYTKLPQNVETYRNNQFINKQLSLFNKVCNVIPLSIETVPITIGYFTDDFFSKLLSIEIVCQALDFRFEIAEPQRIVNIVDRVKDPVRETKIGASQKAKEERLNNGKHKDNAENKQ